MIGAGIAGITAGVLLPKKVPGIQLTIFDKNSDVVCSPRDTTANNILTALKGRHMV